MTQEEKQLLLKDLCARLPYGVKVLDNTFKKYGASELINIGIDGSMLVNNKTNDIQYYPIIDNVKPYLRPMSSMTEEEKGDINNIIHEFGDKWFESGTPDNHWSATFWECSEITDCLLSHHLDFRGLIPMGLALEASEGMYKIE